MSTNETTIMTKKEEAVALIEKLTEREKQIALLTAEGKSSYQISVELCLSEHTVKTHRYNIYRRLRVENNVAVAIIFTIAGLVEDWKVAA